MGVVLEPNDLTDDVRINWWNWRPTVALLLRSGVVSEDLAERLNKNLGGGTVTAREAHAIADAVDVVLQGLTRPEDRLLLDGTVTNKPPEHDGLPVEFDWYGASRTWLETFTDFCRQSGGFTAL